MISINILGSVGHAKSASPSLLMLAGVCVLQAILVLFACVLLACGCCLPLICVGDFVGVFVCRE